MASLFGELLLGTMTVLITLLNDKNIEIDKAKTEFNIENNQYALPVVQEYDFIIVGAGTAGSVVANRLSDKFTVLLLDTGGDPLPVTYIGANWIGYIKDPRVVHMWTSVQQTNACLEKDGYCEISYGNALGGSSTVNGMLYNRGHPMDFVNWAKLVNDESWNYENVLPLFKMHENFIGETSDHLGYGGELNITRKETSLNEQELIWKESWTKAAAELGYEYFENSNMPQKEGFGEISQTTLDGIRVNAYDSFLKPIESRETLTISRYSKATKVEIDESGKAIGVLYEKHGINQYARAKKEIIISAGVMNSPWLLMNSGVGPEDQLNAANIPVIANLPVGQNWQDHPIAITKVLVDKPSYENLSEKDIENFVSNKKGALSNFLGLNSQAFFVSETAKAAGHDLNWPDMQFTLLFKLKEIAGEEEDAMGILVSLGLVQSRGTLTLNTTHPLEPLIWDPNYLKEDRDFNAMLDGLELAAKVFETEPFKALGAKIAPQIPGCENFDLKSRDYWGCYARQKSQTNWHADGSCKMGADDDTTAVVDSKLKVKGISGLRVMDNSIQPTVVNGNTQAPAYMIGEKGAKMVLEEYSK